MSLFRFEMDDAMRSLLETYEETNRVCTTDGQTIEVSFETTRKKTALEVDPVPIIVETKP